MDIPITDQRDCPYGDCLGKGGQHSATCLVPKRAVVLELKTRIIVEVPRTFDTDMVLFGYNEGTHCVSNEFEALAEATKGDDSFCGCACTEFSFLREATPEDLSNGSAINTTSLKEPQ